jgi:putative ATP-dependent endonuclease of OLD family
VLLVSAQKMEESNPDLFQLDVAGICVVNADGFGNLEKLGAFFREIGIPAFAFFDRNKRAPDQIAALRNVYEIAFEIQQNGAEALMAAETPVDRQWQNLEILRNEDSEDRFKIPSGRPTDEVIRGLTESTLKGLKGEGGVASLLERCTVDELPPTITNFLNRVYQRYPKPKRKEIAVHQATPAQQEETSDSSADDKPGVE